MLSDEPCWGQFSRLGLPTPPSTSFSALRRAVLGSIKIFDGEAAPSRDCFSALRRAVLGSMTVQATTATALTMVSVLSDEPCWGQVTASAGAIGGWTLFQCSPTSRVGVNPATAAVYAPRNQVSVLSDEPCWGQCGGGCCAGAGRVCFSALRRAVLGSMGLISSLSDIKTVVSVLSDEPCWGQSADRRRKTRGAGQFQCSPTSRVGVN